MLAAFNSIESNFTKHLEMRHVFLEYILFYISIRSNYAGQLQYHTVKDYLTI